MIIKIPPPYPRKSKNSGNIYLIQNISWIPLFSIETILTNYLFYDDKIFWNNSSYNLNTNGGNYENFSHNDNGSWIFCYP